MSFNQGWKYRDVSLIGWCQHNVWDGTIYEMEILTIQIFVFFYLIFTDKSVTFRYFSIIPKKSVPYPFNVKIVKLVPSIFSIYWGADTFEVQMSNPVKPSPVSRFFWDAAQTSVPHPSMLNFLVSMRARYFWDPLSNPVKPSTVSSTVSTVNNFGAGP